MGAITCWMGEGCVRLYLTLGGGPKYGDVRGARDRIRHSEKSLRKYAIYGVSPLLYVRPIPRLIRGWCESWGWRVGVYVRESFVSD